jgi:hypothetical protein
MLGAAIAPQLWAAMHDQREYDLEQHRAALATLPETGERDRPAPRPARDAQAAVRKRRKAERAARRRSRRR